MRLLVLSNINGGVDKIFHMAKRGSNIDSKEATNLSDNGIVQNTTAALADGSYGGVIIVAKDPIGINILLNKQEGVESVVCASAEDVGLAKENGANVIVIRNINSDELPEIVSAAVGGGMAGGLKSMRMPRFLPKKEEPVEEEGEMQKERTKEKSRPIFRPVKKKDEPEEAEPQRKGDGKSIANKIKNYLGIV